MTKQELTDLKERAQRSLRNSEQDQIAVSPDLVIQLVMIAETGILLSQKVKKLLEECLDIEI